MAYFASVQDPGEGTVHAYDGDVWDAEMMYGCNCDAGYSGPMCSLRSCAVGDDPLTGTDEASRSCYFVFFVLTYCCSLLSVSVTHLEARDMLGSPGVPKTVSSVVCTKHTT